VQYLCLIHHEERDLVPGPDMVAEYHTVRDAMTEAGVYLGSGALQPAGSATTLRVQGGDTLLTDGPFAEMKEQVGGYFVLECADLEEAIRWAATIPGVRRNGSVEIRPILLFGRPSREPS
jgi:hypothetical protein